jgi:hypothetical protein
VYRIFWKVNGMNEQHTSAESDIRETAEFNELLRRLRPNHPLRQFTPETLPGRLLSQEDLYLLLGTLNSAHTARWRERLLAARILERARIMPHKRADITRTLCRILEEGKLSNGVAESGYKLVMRGAVGPGALLALSIAFMWTYSFEGSLLHSAWAALAIAFVAFTFITTALAMLLAPLVFPLVVARDAANMNRLRAAAAGALGRLREPASVGALAKAARGGSLHVRRAAADALEQVLPDLLEFHYGQIGAEAVPNLCDLLYHHDESLDIAILRALGKVGDGRAVRTVEQIAGSWRPVEMCMEAHRILPILRARQQREKDAALLLRPSQSPNDAAQTLLRPAAGPAETDPQLLLRPYDGSADTGPPSGEGIG